MELIEGEAGRTGDVGSCPGCGGLAFVATGPSAPAFAMYTESREYTQPEYSIQECETCGLLYKSATVSAGQLAFYYSEVDFRKWEIPGLFPTERVALSFLKRLPKGASLLDFGCSTGRLLASQVDAYACFGIEIDARAAQRAAQSGLKMLPPELLERETGEIFDGIVMMDVFEHLHSPTKVLRRLSQALKPGGILVIGTGNGDAPACRLDPAQFWYFRNIEHLVMLTFRHAKWLASELGMVLEEWKRVCHYDHSVRARVEQYARHEAFWRFQRGSRLERNLMRRLPGVRKAESWALAPGFSASRDHVVAVFMKPDRAR